VSVFKKTLSGVWWTLDFILRDSTRQRAGLCLLFDWGALLRGLNSRRGRFDSFAGRCGLAVGNADWHLDSPISGLSNLWPVQSLVVLI